MGYEACKNAGTCEPAQGNVGAGTGASCGKYLGIDRMCKSGLGIYAVQVGEIQVAAVVATNPLGDIVDWDTLKPLAGLMTEDKSALASTEQVMYEELGKARDVWKGNTTIGCIITNAKLDKSQCNKLASIAHNGYARTIRPVHTSADGDTIFVMSTAEVECNPDALGCLATEVMGRAINRAALNSEPAYGLKSAQSFT